MSEFGEEIIDRLPANSPLKNTDNSMNKIIQNTIGEWLDNYNDMEFYEQIFIQSATGGYLDLIGRQYGVYRRVEELDEDYRQRIIYEIVGHLTVNYLADIYKANLFVGDYFDAERNTLISGNPYINGNFIGLADSNVQKSLANKFILDNIVYWINKGKTDYILNINNINILNNYGNIYNVIDGKRYFRYNDDLKSVRLYLPNLINGYLMFHLCYGLTNVDLDFPNLSNAEGMFNSCYGLTNVDLDFPNLSNAEYMFGSDRNLKSVRLSSLNLTNWTHMFNDCDRLEYINLTIPQSIVNDMKNYILDLNLQYLETLIINGEEVPL